MDEENYPKMYIVADMDISEKIRQLLDQPGFDDQASLAKRLGVAQSTIARWAAGQVSPQGHHRDAIHALHQATYGDDQPFKVRLAGYIGAGAQLYPIDDGADEWVEAPQDATRDTIAVQIRGTSQLPVFEDGWLIFYSKLLPPENMINRRCVVHLADGRIMLKTLRRGSERGFWTLTSPNDYDVEDVAVEWASPIDWIKPR